MSGLPKQETLDMSDYEPLSQEELNQVSEFLFGILQGIQDGQLDEYLSQIVRTCVIRRNELEGVKDNSQPVGRGVPKSVAPQPVPASTTTSSGHQSVTVGGVSYEFVTKLEPVVYGGRLFQRNGKFYDKQAVVGKAIMLTDSKSRQSKYNGTIVEVLGAGPKKFKVRWLQKPTYGTSDIATTDDPFYIQDTRLAAHLYEGN